MARTLAHDRAGFILDGRRRFILAGTVAYFRLHRDDWRPRLAALKASGFDTVDTYVPWNYHEPSEGTFDFSSGNRDLGAWFTLCAELDLTVYLRPGPYICNEWDGGGLPAWLSTKPGMRLRQAEAPYLPYALRYLAQVDAIARRHQYVDGGAVLLYALENELDFFACDDPHAYISALRDQVRADGITIPLTACIGGRSPLERGMGLVPGVIPSPNVYAGGDLEREAVFAWRNALCGRFADGTAMSDQPLIVTEMHQREAPLRRVLMGGFKGLGPFNFAGGSHVGRWNATNNWGGQTCIATSIDFGGMIGFDGRVGDNFLAARRFAGFVRALEEPILGMDPISSWEGGPSASNGALGAKENPAWDGRIYSLVRGAAAVVSVFNSGAASQCTRLRWRGRSLPEHGELAVAPGYVHLVPIDIPLAHAGLPGRLRHATAEPCVLRREGDAMLLALCGEPGASAELSLAGCAITVEDAGPAAVHRAGDAVTLAAVISEAVESRLRLDGQVLRVRWLTRAAAGCEGLAIPRPEAAPAVDLLGGPWTAGEPPRPEPTRRWEGVEALAMERCGMLQGAAWYELAFTGGGSRLVLPGAAELVDAWLDGRHLGCWLGDGNPRQVPLPEPIPDGAHRLVVRTGIWGHSNFDEGGWPSGGLGSLRGLQGAVLIDGRVVSGSWSVAPEPDQPPALAMAASDGLRLGSGRHRVFARALPDLGATHGAVVTAEGVSCHGEIWLEDALVGRLVCGPTPRVKLTGGPGDRFYLPPASLRPGARLRLDLHGGGADAAITVLKIEPLR